MNDRRTSSPAVTSRAARPSDERLATMAKALGHPARVQIVRKLATTATCNGTEIFDGLPLAQSTVSEHLRILREAGLVSSRSEGARHLFCLTPGALADLAGLIDEIAWSLVSDEGSILECSVCSDPVSGECKEGAV